MTVITVTKVAAKIFFIKSAMMCAIDCAASCGYTETSR